MKFNERLRLLERKREVKTIGDIVDADTIREVETVVTGKAPSDDEISIIMSTRIKSGNVDKRIIHEVETIIQGNAQKG